MTAPTSTATAPTRTIERAPAQKDLLRLITCGSVDDGKSTLIGRLMLDAGAVYSDQIELVKEESSKRGMVGDQIDTSLLLDGLEDERQQGITIDVAYRYFATDKRKFVVADTPGHEQFTRNMATGASNADLTVILVDASKGLLTQTRRHAFIVSLLGIKHIVLAVNKMDLVDYDQGVFEGICDDFRRFAAKLDAVDIRFVPLSARDGENVTQPSAKTLWYADGSLLHQLESIYVAADRNLRDFRFPVQRVNRPDSSFRGYSGTVASGAIRVGEPVTVLPSGKSSHVERIVTMDGDQTKAVATQAVTLTLADEIDISRGDMISRPGNPPRVAQQADAMLVWMAEQPLEVDRPYWIKHAAGHANCEVVSLRYEVDVNTLHRRQAAALTLNGVGRCELRFHQPLCFDAYTRNRTTGAFILVDRVSQQTVAAGMFSENDSDSGSRIDQASYLPPQSVNSGIDPKRRVERYGHSPFTVLITGRPASGKTSLAKELEGRLFDRGMVGLLLDGEHMRQGMSKGLGFSTEERSENLRRAAEVAKLLNDSGQFCVAAFCAPKDATRARFRELVGPDRLLHVHLEVPVEVCRDRDETGRYSAASRGEIVEFPGVQTDYDAAKDADLTIAYIPGRSASEAAQHVLMSLSRFAREGRVGSPA